MKIQPLLLTVLSLSLCALACDAVQISIEPTTGAPTLSPVPVMVTAPAIVDPSATMALLTATPAQDTQAISTPSFTPTAGQPTPTAPRPTVTPLPTQTSGIPQIIDFEAPATINLGQAFNVNWVAEGGQAALCPIFAWSGYVYAPSSAECVDVPLTGSGALTAEAGTVHFRIAEQEIVVDVGSSASANNQPYFVGLRFQVAAPQVELAFTETYFSICYPNAPGWFFTPAPKGCPMEAALTLPAAAQRFEHGQMIWVGASRGFFVLFEDQSMLMVPEELVGSLYTRDIKWGTPTPEPAPGGYFTPVSGFGYLWRGEVVGTAGLRERLGWAVEPEHSFQTSFQCEWPSMAGRACYLRGSDGQVLVIGPASSWATYP